MEIIIKIKTRMKNNFEEVDENEMVLMRKTKQVTKSSIREEMCA